MFKNVKLFNMCIFFVTYESCSAKNDYNLYKGITHNKNIVNITYITRQVNKSFRKFWGMSITVLTLIASHMHLASL